MFLAVNSGKTVVKKTPKIFLLQKKDKKQENYLAIFFTQGNFHHTEKRKNTLAGC